LRATLLIRKSGFAKRYPIVEVDQNVDRPGNVRIPPGAALMNVDLLISTRGSALD
jgi:hypothetical protein